MLTTLMKTNVYIDGLNLYNGAVKGTKNKWLDPQALVQALLPTASINQIRYFTARVKHAPMTRTRRTAKSFICARFVRFRR